MQDMVITRTNGVAGRDGVAVNEAVKSPESPTRPAERKEISILPAGEVFWLKPDRFGDREG